MYLVPGLLAIRVDTFTKQEGEKQLTFLGWCSPIVQYPFQRRYDRDDYLGTRFRMILRLMAVETERLMLREVIVVFVAEQSQIIEIATIAKILGKEHAQALFHLFRMLISFRDYTIRIKLI